MKISAYRIVEDPMIIRPCSNKREWMDNTINQYAYRCLPLQIVNSSGWELLSPTDFYVTWTGGKHKDDLSVHAAKSTYEFAASSFGHGILTIHPGYLFRTDEDWDLFVSGVPNFFYDFMTPLSGIVETWWLQFTFTMNWKIQKPGTYFIKEGEPLAFIMPIPHSLPKIETFLMNINDDKEVLSEYNKWANRRNRTLKALDHMEKTGQGILGVEPSNPATHWEKNYIQGKTNDGTKIEEHLTKRKFPEFKEK